jgi:hypothetical protein
MQDHVFLKLFGIVEVQVATGHIPGSIHVKTAEIVSDPSFLMAEVRSRKVHSTENYK